MDAKLQLQAVAPGERHAALSAVRDAFAVAGAWLLDVRLYSDLSACFEIEVPAAAGPVLRVALEQGGVRLDAASAVRLDELVDLGQVEVAGTLALVFAGGRGDLRQVVPAVPG